MNFPYRIIKCFDEVLQEDFELFSAELPPEHDPIKSCMDTPGGMFQLSYCPMPDTRIMYEKPLPTTTDRFKVKYYQITDKIKSVRSEMELLHTQGYTHFVNMPGGMVDILSMAAFYKLICWDYRLTVFLADTHYTTKSSATSNTLQLTTTAIDDNFISDVPQ
jgi:hypothetical protein